MNILNKGLMSLVFLVLSTCSLNLFGAARQFSPADLETVFNKVKALTAQVKLTAENNRDVANFKDLFSQVPQYIAGLQQAQQDFATATKLAAIKFYVNVIKNHIQDNPGFKQLIEGPAPVPPAPTPVDPKAALRDKLKTALADNDIASRLTANKVTVDQVLADPDRYINPEFKNTILMIAANLGKTQLVKDLLAYGANPDKAIPADSTAVAQRGFTALSFAQNRFPEVVAALIAKK